MAKNSDEAQDKTPLSKAKDSREEAEQQIKSIEASIDKVTEKPNGKPVVERVDDHLLTELKAKIDEYKTDLQDLEAKITEKSGELRNIEEKMRQLRDVLGQKEKDQETLNAELKVLKLKKDDLENNSKTFTAQLETTAKDLQTKQMELMVASEEIKHKQIDTADLTKQQESLKKDIQEKEDTVKNLDVSITEHKGQITKQDEEINKLYATIKQGKELVDSTSASRELIKTEIAQLQKKQQESTEEQVKLDDILDKLKDEIIEREKQNSILEASITTANTHLTEKLSSVTEFESRIELLKARLDNLNQQVRSQENVVKLKEDRANELGTLTEKKTAELDAQAKLLNDLDKKLTEDNEKYQNLVRLNESIEVAITYSRKHIDEVKAELEKQEKVFQEKETRLHRLDVLSFIYRLIKVVGGIMMGAGILFIIIGLSYALSGVDLGSLNKEFLIYVALIGGTFLLVSGIFQLERT
jgi:chromosome segregation ATPase